ncbi:MAG: hypothetical protein NT080_14180 [Spirochaetes bacterium]|nr:hypothetical protein [Spirochaetota bacterium]
MSGIHFQWKRALISAAAIALVCLALSPLQGMIDDMDRDMFSGCLRAHEAAARWKSPIRIDRGASSGSIAGVPGYDVLDKASRRVGSAFPVVMRNSVRSARFMLVLGEHGEPSALLALDSSGGLLEKQAAFVFARMTGTGETMDAFPGSPLERIAAERTISGWIAAAGRE